MSRQVIDWVGHRPATDHRQTASIGSAVLWTGILGRVAGSAVDDAAREMLVAVNPDPDSRLPYLLRLPLGPGMVFRTAGTWPRTKALFCYPLEPESWPEEPEIVERVPVRSCVRRGAAIELVLDRSRENRSQLVFTKARGRDAVFWQSPRTRKQARPNVSTPTARAAGIPDLEILVDTRERYAYRFASQQVSTVKRALSCGDYGVSMDGRVIAAVERKSLADLVSSLIGGTLRYALGDLAALPRAAVVVEERYSQVFKLQRVRPAVVADGLAELQVRWPDVPIMFCETRQLAEEWTYRYLAAAHAWARTEAAMGARVPAPSLGEPTVTETGGEPTVTETGGEPTVTETGGEPTVTAPAGGPATREVRAWARSAGLDVPDRGRLRPEIWHAWREAQQQR